VEVAHNRERFDCNHCRNQKHCDDSNPAQFPMFVIAEIGLESRTCLLPMITEFSYQMLNLFGHYQSHVLPLSGGVLEQPNIYTESMRVIDNHTNKLKAERNG